jgi:hypothetical protein
VTAPAPISRETVVGIIAAHRNQPAATVPEQIDSLGVAWLVHEAERMLGVPLELTDELLEQMSTVTGAVQALRQARHQPAGGDG